MAEYRVGNRILSEEEYNEDRTALLAVGFFIICAFIVGYQVHQVISQEWSKVIRFILVLLTAVIGGLIPVFFVDKIRALSIWVLGFSIIGCFGYWLWVVV